MLMKIQSENANNELSKLKFENEMLCDFSTLPKTHPNHSSVVKGQLGTLKCKLKSIKVIEYVGLAKKQYSLNFLDGENYKTIMKNKGIPKSALENYTFYNYKKALLEKKTSKTSFASLRSFNQEICLINNNKILFSPVHFSRFLLGIYGIRSLPYGYKNLTVKEMDSVDKEDSDSLDEENADADK